MKQLTFGIALTLVAGAFTRSEMAAAQPKQTAPVKTPTKRPVSAKQFKTKVLKALPDRLEVIERLETDPRVYIGPTDRGGLAGSLWQIDGGLTVHSKDTNAPVQRREFYALHDVDTRTSSVTLTKRRTLAVAARDWEQPPESNEGTINNHLHPRLMRSHSTGTKAIFRKDNFGQTKKFSQSRRHLSRIGDLVIDINDATSMVEVDDAEGAVSKRVTGFSISQPKYDVNMMVEEDETPSAGYEPASGKLWVDFRKVSGQDLEKFIKKLETLGTDSRLSRYSLAISKLTHLARRQAQGKLTDSDVAPVFDLIK